MQCGIGWCGHCQLGPLLLCRDGPVVGYDIARSAACGQGVMMSTPTLAVWKFASCDGCQLTLLDCEDELLTLASRGPDRALPRGLQRRSSADPTTCRWSRAPSPPRPTRSGSARSANSRGCWSRSARARPPAASRRCATSPTSPSSLGRVRQPEYIDTLATSTPISAHVTVDFELRGCPIDAASCSKCSRRTCWSGASRTSPSQAVCTECKLRGADVRHGRRRHAVPRARSRTPDAARCVPASSRLLRLFRPDEPSRQPRP